MTQELFKIETNEQGQQLMSARELHSFLESRQDFSTWIKSRIENYGFVEDVEYTVLHKKMEQVSGTKHLIEYAITLDMAKELSMVERNERGKQARQYFIEKEKELREVQQTKLPGTYKEALLALVEAEEERERLQLIADEKEKQLQIQQPKVQFAEAMLASTTSCLIGELAKVLTQNGFSIGQNKLFEWLRNNGYLGKVGERRNIPNQQWVTAQYFELKHGVRSDSQGVMHTTITTKVTPKGQQYFINLFLKNN